jgi:excisionase family DNA binding protein
MPMNNPPPNNPFNTADDRPPTLLTIPETCDILRISRWSVYQLINKGRLKTIRIDRRRLIVSADLTALIEELREEEATHGS